jgi:hypothetical protein
MTDLQAGLPVDTDAEWCPSTPRVTMWISSRLHYVVPGKVNAACHPRTRTYLLAHMMPAHAVAVPALDVGWRPKPPGPLTPKFGVQTASEHVTMCVTDADGRSIPIGILL